MDQSPNAIQEKCSISSLLTESNITNRTLSTQEIKENLDKTKESLLHLLDILQSTTEFDMECFNYEVSISLSSFQNLKQTKGILFKDFGESFSEVAMIAKDVLLLLQERKKLQDQINEFRSHFDENPKKRLVFNVITQRMMRESSNGCIPHRRRRLERGKVGVLQTWYNKHFEKPYLNEETLNSLVDLTGLTKVQIRNWISNKRRKEKNVLVSDELSALLNDSSEQ